jgi:hypothetical protein
VIRVEQRRAERVECLIAGQIELNNGSEIRCEIRNLSLYGACLQVSSHYGVPEDILLWILGECVKRPCCMRANAAMLIKVTANVFRMRTPSRRNSTRKLNALLPRNLRVITGS